MASFCPATMCPFFAKDGSPWTGTSNAPCTGAAHGGDCGWGENGYCLPGRDTAATVENEAAEKKLIVVRSVPACVRAAECAWQQEAAPTLCAPRLAFIHGLDPKVCAF